ncbi:MULTISPECIES: hypothetical protein [Paenibacillus]|uniref:Uncharacterized protein n=1 Tax=Paenibacillus vandeheii TaxID=3035917 RepID=A0ABT8JFJ3_9BACL|nr:MULTISPECIES: hypothetical protein [Paenibacillus]KGP81951.1 hypothetical protein P364_0114100 [Paenibacillus sp. MAEPY2]KGP86037.1 hypothetical protein P363_0119575 [Paenibacillus sp. MAEPY1]MDN4603866.1 hypothetical protein [Paenibacillus vandeheii]
MKKVQDTEMLILKVNPVKWEEKFKVKQMIGMCFSKVDGCYRAYPVYSDTDQSHLVDRYTEMDLIFALSIVREENQFDSIHDYINVNNRAKVAEWINLIEEDIRYANLYEAVSTY